MNSSDYIFSLQALNLWLEDLESPDHEGPDPERVKIIHQVSECFNNVFKKFSDQYEDETGMKPPENLCEVMIYSGQPKRCARAEDKFRREVNLTGEVVESIRSLIDNYNYVKLKKPFHEYNYSGRIYLNIEEAEALIELVIIEQKKALLKYPNYDKNLEDYSRDDEDMVLNIQQGLYEKVVIGITEVFKEFDRECLI